MSETNSPVAPDEQLSATSTTTDPIIEVRDATVTFHMDRGESRVLDNVSLGIERQEILGVVGESGSGKSMFASALLDAVVNPGELTGEISYSPEPGKDIDVLSLSQADRKRLRWEEIAMVFQGAQSSFNPTLKIKGHFVETLEAHNYAVDSGIERARDLLTDLYLDPDRVFNAYSYQLSGGMQQRVLIALSLVLEPNVLVMDEPTAALDLLMQRSILSLLSDMKEKYNLTVVFITHDLPLVAGLADRLAVMYAFEIAELGEAREIVMQAAHPYTRALLRSVPNLETPFEDMRAIEGAAPDPVNKPSGCNYHPRCPLATEECKRENPHFRTAHEDLDHQVACFHWEDAEEAVPFDIEEHTPVFSQEDWV